MLIVEDLHVGALIGKKTFWRWFGLLPRYVMATGYGDVRKRDIIEIYARQVADGEPLLAPGYQDLVERREELGRAEVGAVDDGPVGGPVAQATLSEGRLAVGDRVRVLRDGRPLAEALRLLSMTDPAGRANDRDFAGGGASLRLGHTRPRPRRS
ncbi:hypothetical protein ACQPZP_36960 [Spirillospora sp. CA-142024]|uniref:hypothetical protein n=1 Tax=Spirillospora sp. CA-142024 TaxID=3240036 RepID=UPI003D910DB2